MVDLTGTYGALLVGAFVGLMLSGVLGVQTVIYLKMYRNDAKYIKSLVLSIWFLDMMHSGFVCATLWDYLISHFGDSERIDYIPWPLPATVLCTLVVTFLVHVFFTYRIHRLSKQNWWMTGPIGVFVICRSGAACASAARMITLGRFHLFLQQYRWIPTVGLVLSCVVDVLITASLFYCLGLGRTISPSLDAAIDSLLLYAFENGALTCAATIASMICWLVMPRNLVFVGTHFVISKLYANSLLTTLNTRKQIRRASLSANQYLAPSFMVQPRPRSEMSAFTAGRWSGSGRRDSSRPPAGGFTGADSAISERSDGLLTRNGHASAGSLSVVKIGTLDHDVERLEDSDRDRGFRSGMSFSHEKSSDEIGIAIPPPSKPPATRDRLR